MEEDIITEERRINDIRLARVDAIRDVIREARIEIPKFLLDIEKKYRIKIDEEWRIDVKILKDKKEKVRRRR